MSRRIIRYDEAKQDIITQAFYIGERNLDASDRFLEATGNVFLQLADMPGLGVPRDFGRSNLAGMRMLAVPGFAKYLIGNHSCSPRLPRHCQSVRSK